MHACLGHVVGRFLTGVHVVPRRLVLRHCAAAGEDGQRRHVDQLCGSCGKLAIVTPWIPRAGCPGTPPPAPAPTLLILKDFQAFKNIFPFFFFPPFWPQGPKMMEPAETRRRATTTFLTNYSSQIFAFTACYRGWLFIRTTHHRVVKLSRNRRRFSRQVSAKRASLVAQW